MDGGQQPTAGGVEGGHSRTASHGCRGAVGCLVTAKVTDDKKGATDAEAKIKTTEETIKTTATAKEAAVKTLAEKTEAVKGPLAAKEAADKELQEAAAAAKAELDKSNAAKEASDKDTANADLKKAAEDAKKAADEAEVKRKAAEKKVEDAAAPATKAQQEATAAEAANMAAEQATLAAAAANKKAIDALPVAQATVKAAEALLVETQAKLDAAKNQATAMEKPFRTLAYSPDGSALAAAGDNRSCAPSFPKAAPHRFVRRPSGPRHGCGFRSGGRRSVAGRRQARHPLERHTCLELGTHDRQCR